MDKMLAVRLLLGLLLCFPRPLNGRRPRSVPVPAPKTPLTGVWLSAQEAGQPCQAPRLDGGYFIPSQRTFGHQELIFYACGKGHKTVEDGWWASSTCLDGKWFQQPRCIGEPSPISSSLSWISSGKSTLLFARYKQLQSANDPQRKIQRRRQRLVRGGRGHTGELRPGVPTPEQSRHGQVHQRNLDLGTGLCE